jgi:radical SAM superfamily enzyme YgiQ (UPF0313 family)
MKLPLRTPKLLIIVLSRNLPDEESGPMRYPMPPLPGLLLAGMTPPLVEVEVLHEIIRPIDYHADADYIALSFLDYCAPHAYEVAAHFRGMGRIVVGGGKYVTAFPDEAQPHFDGILVGEAQGVWPRMVEDMVAGQLKPRYVSEESASLAGIPPPRYDLAERGFGIPMVTEATRGCPHVCMHCQLNIHPVPFRMRPIEDVLRDLRNTWRLPYFKRKFAILLDNNLGGDLDYARRLLREIARLGFWGIAVQCSIDALRDTEFVDALVMARCRLVSVGMESLQEGSLSAVAKRQNRPSEYGTLFAALQRRGILVFAGMMFGLDRDDASYYEALPAAIDQVGPAVIFSYIAAPPYGTPLYQQLLSQGRIRDHALAHHEGRHFIHSHGELRREEVLDACRRVTRTFYGRVAILRRWWRLLRAVDRKLPFSAYFNRILFASLFYWHLTLHQRRQMREDRQQRDTGVSAVQEHIAGV